MIQGGSGLGLALKPAECLRIFGNVVGKKLKRNKPPKLHVLSLVNHTIPPPPSFSTMR
jgi:hypothetical protein